MKKASNRRDMRRFERRTAAVPVTVQAAGNKVQGGIRLDSLDLSEGGTFLLSDYLFEVGEMLTLEIPLPSGEVAKVAGRVVRVSRSPGEDELPGMGVEFTKLSLPDRKALGALLIDPPTAKGGASS